MIIGRCIDIICALALAAWMAVAGFSGEARAAAYDISRLDRMPDFTQTDRRLKLPGGGSHYCVPVSAANVLVWLAEYRGYKNLLPVQGLSTIDKVASVAGRLGSREFMSTAPKGGTSGQKFLDGLASYVEQSGYRAAISAEGRWAYRNHDHRVGAPDMAEVTRQFARGNAVWLTIGFYREGDRRGDYRRVSGHMVTLAGFGVDARGNTDRDVLILHDPDDGSSDQAQQLYVRMESLRNARFTDGAGDEEGNGYVVLNDGYRLKNGYHAIIDAVFLLDM